MSALILPRRFSQQPQWPAEIDWGNPLTRGVVVAVAGNERLNNAGQRFPTITGSVARLGSPHGAAHSFSAGAYFDYGHTAATEITGPITIFGLLRPVSGATQARIISKATVDQTDNPYRLSFESSNNGLYWLRATTAAQYGAWRPNATAATAGVMNRFAVVAPGSTIETTPRFYTGLSGSDLGATRLFSSHTGPVTSTGAPLRIGNWDTGSQVDIALLLVFNRAISGGEYAALAANPWQIFKPRRQVLYFGGTGGSGITIACTPGNTTAAGVTAAVSQAITLPATVGNAVAAGTTASISQAITLSATVGNATAAGTTATVTQAVTINTTVGDAVAAGITAGIDLAGSITIACTVGGATAAGVAANVAQGLILGCQVGNALADGVAADVAITVTVTCTPGNATADGIPATIYAGETVTCTVGAATAAGIPSSITVTGTLTDSQKIDLILDILQNKQVLDPASGMYTLYADDGVTVLYTAQAWEDAAGTVPYSGGCVRRLDAMQ